MFEKIKIYMRSKDKVYIYMNEEILFFENQELSSILENLREESEIDEEMAISVILHYPYFLFEEDLQAKNNFINKNMKYIYKKYYLNHMENRYVNLYMERKQINDIKNSCRQAGFKLMDIKTDFDIIYGFSKEEDIEILQVGEINSVRMLVKNEKIEELERKKADEVFKKSLKKLQDDIPLGDNDFKEICEVINSKNYDIVQLGALLVLISEKSLYPESLTAFVKNILEYSTTFSDDTPMIDLCGTGGDGLKTINISTTVAFIVAAMGVKVAKHGNKSVTSKSGSSDVIDKLGLTMEKSLITQLNKLENSNLAFFHAPFFHKLVGEVREVRQRLGIRTVFNVLGPLLHPNRKLKYQLVGLYHEPVHRLYAETLQLLGREHALVVRGNDGLDEISICDETKIVEVKGDKILEYTVSPETFGFKRAFHADIEGGTPEENAEVLVRTLKGEENSPKSDIVILNAMFALYTANVVKHPAEAKPLILEAINSGKVYDFYKKYTGK